jgi:FkbM family methyltransferase
MKIKYGIPGKTIDVTDICLTSPKLFHNNVITIPSGDENRAHHFTDPVPRVVKQIFIQTTDNNNDGDSEIYFDQHHFIKINIKNNTVDVKVIDENGENKKIEMKLSLIHSKLKIIHGSFNDEFPEQKMAIKYLTGNEKVLEIGGNIGRNSLVIAQILRESGGELNDLNLVTMECSTEISKLLMENRNLNGLHFHIENSALSMKKLIQNELNVCNVINQTLPSDTLLPGHTWVNTVTWNELKAKYHIDFDTLVLDCEGAFYYVLLDMPEMLENIKLIIMENDYWDLNHKNVVDAILIKNNFYVDYVESGGWGPCYHNFFEVWKKEDQGSL